jgi:hypothetical protein
VKKNHARSRRSLRRGASRAKMRRSEAATRINVRRPSAAPVPLDNYTDNCQFYLAPESYAERPIAGATDPLDALDACFRAFAGWRKLPGPDPTRALNVTVGMRRPPREFVAGSGLRFVAIDPTSYRGNAIRGQAAHQAFWDHQLNGRPVTMPFLKSGLTIWRKLGIDVSPETTAYMMQMLSVDPETSEAIQAAIWSAFNTASYPIDIETAVFVLAAFMHADPLRQHLVSNEKFIEPYGDRTQYVLQPVYDPTSILATRDSLEGPDIPPASPRHLPIEAGDDLRRRIEADPMINPDHLDTLDGLKRLRDSDAEKDRVYCGSLDAASKEVLDLLLQVAIREVEVECATVAGVINALILAALDIRVAERRNELSMLIL